MAMPRYEVARRLAREGPNEGPVSVDQGPQRHQRADHGRQAALEPSRRAHADQLTHDEAEIEASGMNQQALQDVRVPTQMRPPHPARVIDMREGPFDALAPLPHQAASAGATHATSIAIYRRL